MSATKRPTADLPEACKSLPKEVQARLAEFLASIQSTRFLQPDGKPKPEWKMFYGATWEEASRAAHRAATDAAGGFKWSPVDDQEGTIGVREARDAAAIAAYHAAEDAAMDAERSAELIVASGVAKDAASAHGFFGAIGLDAELMARLLTVSDLNFENKEGHIAHAKARWEVWQKGYGICHDVNGVLYVYCNAP